MTQPLFTIRTTQPYVVHLCRNINSTLTNISVKVSIRQLFQSKLNSGAHRVKHDPIGA